MACASEKRDLKEKTPKTSMIESAKKEEKQIYLSADMACRLAAIDIGSNSVRLLVAEALRGGVYRILDEEREPTRLGKSVSTEGQLDTEAMDRTIHVLGTFKKIAAGFQVSGLRTIATCAVREAKNGPAFCRRIREQVGLDVEVISGEREAQLAFTSVQRAFDLNDRNLIVADIGGGSTEIVFGTGNLIESIFSTPLGAVRLTEEFRLGEEAENENYLRNVRRMEQAITNCLKRETSKPHFAPHFMVGCGGTFTTLAELLMASKKESNTPVAGYKASHAEIHHLLDKLRKMSIKSRRSVAGMSPDRADIIIAGLSIIDALMTRFRVNTLITHTRGVRDGLVREMIDEALGGTVDDPVLRDAAIEKLAATCSGEVEHGRTVATLATRIFDQLVEPFGLHAEDRQRLEWAAILQDVGYIINYDQHHKHSYHLIRNSRIPGIRGHELELIANIARYHRGAIPKRKHENFSRLSADEKKRVQQMAGILRLAGGLDRSRSQQVKDVRVFVEPKSIVLKVSAETEPQVDIWGAERRAQLFEKVFGLPLKIIWDQEKAVTDHSE